LPTANKVKSFIFPRKLKTSFTITRITYHTHYKPWQFTPLFSENHASETNIIPQKIKRYQLYK